jgi:hypothetical protein
MGLFRALESLIKVSQKGFSNDDEEIFKAIEREVKALRKKLDSRGSV